MQDQDGLDNDDDPRALNSASLPPPGPILSPDDPRYGRPSGAPVYSDRGPQQGPVMSPDDPRYGHLGEAPAVIYSDRPAGPPQQLYSDRGDDRGDNRIPGSGIVYPNEDNRAMRPPEVLSPPGAVTGSVQPQRNGGGAMVLSSLPAGEQPESGPAKLEPRFQRQEVDFATKEPAGTIVVDTPNTYLYYVLGGGRAIRYGIRVGRDGFRWNGVQKITRKTEWPDWHPPSEMIERQPYLPRFMAGGEGNPLGARAMYLGSTVYRIHGTNQPSTIGKTVSSGCFGMLNEDVMNLFDRVKVGTRVVVLPGNPPPSTATASAQPMPGQPGQAMSAANAGLLPPMSSAPGTGPTLVPPLPAPVNVR